MLSSISLQRPDEPYLKPSAASRAGPGDPRATRERRRGRRALPRYATHLARVTPHVTETLMKVINK
jgi:hypothetical protein